MHFSVADVVAATSGRLTDHAASAASVPLSGVGFDSRVVRPGQLFVAVVADRDGHDFVAQAQAAGAAAALVERHLESVDIPQIVVPDSIRGLLALGAWARRRLDGVVIGITGSVGKTSTKDLARAALAAGLRTAANERSFNNDQGLPVTILNAADDTEALVLEMGMRGFGEIERLCAVAAPAIGVVTRVAPAHTERVGDIDGVARAKAELVQALPATGTAILNVDDARVWAMSARTSATVLGYGSDRTADVRIESLSLDELARPRFVLATPWGRVEIALGVSGAHMASNAAAAIAVAGTCGVDLGAAAAALADAALSPARMQVGRTPRGVLVINDAYNANPESMRAALDALAAIGVSGRRVAVVGQMAELADPQADHVAIAAYAETLGIELVAFGTTAYGVSPVEDPLAVTAALGSTDAVLVKGSLVAGMQAVAASIMAQPGA